MRGLSLGGANEGGSSPGGVREGGVRDGGVREGGHAEVVASLLATGGIVSGGDVRLRLGRGRGDPSGDPSANPSANPTKNPAGYPSGNLSSGAHPEAAREGGVSVPEKGALPDQRKDTPKQHRESLGGLGGVRVGGVYEKRQRVSVGGRSGEGGAAGLGTGDWGPLLLSCQELMGELGMNDDWFSKDLLPAAERAWLCDHVHEPFIPIA